MKLQVGRRYVCLSQSGVKVVTFTVRDKKDYMRFSRLRERSNVTFEEVCDEDTDSIAALLVGAGTNTPSVQKRAA